MPPIITVIVLAVVSIAVLATVQTAYWAWIAREEKAKQELQRRLGMAADNEAQNQSILREKARDAATSALGSLGATLQDALDGADSQLTAQALLLRMVGTGFVVGFFGAIFVHPAVGLGLALVATYIPLMLIKNAGAARAKALVQQLPDALDLISRSLQAGVGLNDTFRMVAEEMPMPVAGEFARVFEEIRFGREFRVAMEMLLKRNPGVFDLRLFVSSVLLARETGGNLIEILENISKTIRNRFLFDAKVRAMTSEARTSAMVLGGLPLAVGCLVAVMNPDYLTPLLTDSLGNIFLMYSAGSYSAGVYVMNEMSKVEV